ncbi:MAG: hypothetical protein ACK533_00800, partial [Planctomycetota bacterium]
MTAKTTKSTPKKPKPKPAAAKKAPKGKPAPATPTRNRKGETSGADAPTKGRSSPPAFVPRAVTMIDDDDVLMAHGGGGVGYGRCGGRMLSSRLEQDLCNRLGMAGVVHSHSPRHYEIRFEDN